MAQEHMKQIEAEMARFENEISTSNQHQLPHPLPPTQFLPYSLQRARMPMPYSALAGGPPRLPPPPPMMGMMPPLPLPMMMPPRGAFLPPPPPPMQKPTGPAVIEGAPTRYQAPGAKAAAGSGVTVPSAFDRAAKDRDKDAGEASATAGPSRSSVLPMFLQQDVDLVQQRKQEDAAFKNSYIGQVLSGKKKPKRFIRSGGGEKWEDPSLAEWDVNDYRIFCGDLGNEVNDELLAKAFRKYPSFQKAKVVRNKNTNKTKGFGFVSFKDPQDFIKAMKEMNGKYVGNRPIKLRKSNWKERSLEVVRKKNKEKSKLGFKV